MPKAIIELDKIGEFSCGVTRMSAARAYILAIFSLASALQVLAGQESAPVSPEAAEAARTQVRINREILVDRTKDEKTRLDAAKLMLASDVPGARKELLAVLRDGSNSFAQAAICQALAIARENKIPVTNKAEFIDPLMGILKTETDPARVELASQALLMLSYNDIQRRLEGLVDDPNMPKTAVLNGIRALKYQPDERALTKLIRLVGRTDAAVSGESKKALALIGIDVPSDPNGIRSLIDGLDRKGPEAYITNSSIMKNWLISLENQNIELRLSLKGLEQRFLAALDKLYSSQADDKARSDYLAQQLASQEPSVKLWALGKLDGMQRGTGRSKFSDQLKTMLLGLISHDDKRVRLKAANLLASMWEVNSAGQLLTQLRVEEEPDVRLAIFTALGSVCYYASKPTSPSRVSEEVRRTTLELALGFLGSADMEEIQAGADVIRKLLEQDGLKANEVNRYLKVLLDRYRQVDNLRAELLTAMASLCDERSVCRNEAVKLYSPVFEQALGDKTDSVRLAAIDGLIDADKIAALKRLRNVAVKDTSLPVRTKLVELAGDVGASEDLSWLFPKIGQSGEGDAAWQAMLKIFKRSSMEVLDEWMTKPDFKVTGGVLSYEQKVSFLALIEQKAQSDKDTKKLKAVRERLFALYASGTNSTKASDCMTSLLSSAADDLERQITTSNLADICLGLPTPNVDLAATLIEKYLKDKDLDSQSSLAQSIKLYVNEPPAGVDPNVLLDRLRQIKFKDPQARGLWKDQLTQWELDAKAKKPKEAEKEGK
jgi:hypothetical protein